MRSQAVIPRLQRVVQREVSESHIRRVQKVLRGWSQSGSPGVAGIPPMCLPRPNPTYLPEYTRPHGTLGRFFRHSDFSASFLGVSRVHCWQTHCTPLLSDIRAINC